MLPPIQELHDSEIAGGLEWPEASKILVYLGCPLVPPPRTRMYGEALVNSFAEAEDWLRRRARNFGMIIHPALEPREDKPIVQRLFEAGIPGSLYWIYDSAFGMTLGEKEGGASNFAEAELWLAENAPIAG